LILAVADLLVLIVLVVIVVRRLPAREERERGDALLETRLGEAVGLAAAKGQREVERRLGEFEKAAGRDSTALREVLLERFGALNTDLVEQMASGKASSQASFAEFRDELKQALADHGMTFERRQAEALKVLQDSLREGMKDVKQQLSEALTKNAEDLGQRVDRLTERTDSRLKEISGEVEKRLTEGFEKTTETFISVLQHLERIDEAQKKITELSGNVVSLQEVLTDKRSRGAFGEVQLHSLVRNVMPESAFEFQKTLSNGTRVDCLLLLPEPTGNVPIDAKFPLENYRTMLDPDLGESDRAAAARLFKQDVRKHIRDIAEKYIIPGETTDGAMQHRRVWMVSPTTLMAILTTAGAVLKDEATREQVHIIQEHLRALSGDFERFRKRMDNLAKHIDQAHRDVREVHISAGKITNRFLKIEKVELDEGEGVAGLLGDSGDE